MKNFWLRQVVGRATPVQERFDAGAIVVAPLACWAIDPGVLRDGHWGAAILSDFRIGVYAAAIAAMISYFISRYWQRAPAVVRAVSAAGQLSGGIAALLLGLRLLPHVVILSFTIVALLGLLPLATSASLLRRGVRDLSQGPRQHRALGLVVGCLLGLVFPAAIGWANWESNPDRRLLVKLEHAHAGDRIPLRELFPGPWNRVHVFRAYTNRESINRALGFQWDSSVASTQETNESNILLVFVKGTTVVHYASIPTKTGFVCVDDTAIWQIRDGKCRLLGRQP